MTSEERANTIISIVKELNSLLAESEKNKFGLLSYLLKLAVLEAQDIASGESSHFDRNNIAHPDEKSL